MFVNKKTKYFYVFKYSLIEHIIMDNFLRFKNIVFSNKKQNMSYILHHAIVSLYLICKFA